MSATTEAALPCAACKQPVIEKRTLDGAVVVLDAATRRLHLCVKRKEVEAAKAKQIAASRAQEKARPPPRPPVKRVAVATPAAPARAERPPRPAKPERKQRPRKGQRRSP